MAKNISMGRKVLVAALLASAGAGLPQVAVAQQATETEAAGDEIIVTAQRREERAQDVPIMITAVSAEGLRERGVTDLQGLQNQVPSLIIAPNGQAARDVMSPSIRGQGTSFQGSPGVVVYMNEVPLVPGISLSTQGGPGTFVDLQNVQVLSGVQGTLFGRNTTGGAVLLTAARPTDRLEGYISGGYGNYNMTELEAVVNIPLTDRLAVRLVGASRKRDGYSYDLTWNKDRDNVNWRMARIGIQWDPTDAISSYTMASYGRSQTNGTGTVPIAFNPDFPCGINPTYTCDDRDQIIADQQGRSVREVAHGINSFYDHEYKDVMNSTSIELTNNLTLRNIASFAETKIFYANDGDGSIANVYNTGNTNLSRQFPKDHYKQFTEELQFQGEALDNNLKYTAGVFYSHNKPGGPNRDFSTNRSFTIGDDLSERNYAFREVSLTNESTALFAQATLNLGALTPALDGVRLTGGYRYTWDSIEGSSISYKPNPDNANEVRCTFSGLNTTPENASSPVQPIYDGTGQLTGFSSDGGCKYSATGKSKASNWLIGVDYKPIEELLLYAKVSRGYKGGGFNAFAVNYQYGTFGPETVTDYEAGFKSNFEVAGRPTRLNVNGYYMDYKNIQRALADFNPSSGRAGAATLNTPSARIQGIEVELMIRPVDGVEIGGNYSYTDAKYKSFTYEAPFELPDCNTSPSNGFALTYTPNLACVPLQFIAPHIFSVYGRVDLPLPESVGQVSLFASYSWNDKQATSAESLEKFVGSNVIWEPGVVLPAYGTLNASLTWKDFMQSGLELSVFGTNLTNKTYRISNAGVYNSSGVHSEIYGEPRMYGMRLKYAFGK